MVRRKKILIAFFVFFACTLGAGIFVAHADTASDLAAKITTQNKAIADLEAEIAKYQSQLTALGKEKNTLANAIKTLTIEGQKLAADIRVTEDRIKAQNLALESLGASIQQTGDNIDSLKDALAKSLREMNAEDTNSIAQFILSTRSLADMWHHAAEQSAFRNGITEKTGQLTTTKTALEGNKTRVEAAKAQLVLLEDQLQDQKTINQKNQAQKNTLLKSTKNQETSYQKLVAQKAALKKQMETDLRDYESRLKYVLNPSSLPAAGSSPLAWPLDKVVITQLFGKTAAAGRLYTSGSHNGIDFGVPTGTAVRAMATGMVVDYGNADISCPGASYGNWILIKYDNGLSSVYGHLSLVKASRGGRVSTGDVVAYSGATGYATGPHLHISVFPNDGVKVNSFASQSCPGRTITIPTAAVNAYLDPMLYLPKR
jgi:murein DD-endopeptidase MepM/ murein hydrolase activator NlpD